MAALFAKDRCKAFVDWVQTAVDTGRMKAIYRWTKDATVVPLDVYINPSNTALNAPSDIADAIADKWGNTWGDSPEEAHRQRDIILSHVNRHRALAASRSAPTRFEGPRIREVWKSFPTDTAIGGDGWEPRTLNELPGEAVDEYGVRIGGARDTVTVPYVAITPHMATIGKKKIGDTRAIGMLSTWHRSDAKLDYPDIQDWDRAHGHSDDSAKPGCSAATAAADRAINRGAGASRGHVHGHHLVGSEGLLRHREARQARPARRRSRLPRLARHHVSLRWPRPASHPVQGRGICHHPSHFSVHHPWLLARPFAGQALHPHRRDQPPPRVPDGPPLSTR